MNKPKIIAYYLPQFHPFKENDEWWGKGFTEWTNVAKAKPLFPGHYQPKIPADLGFYDLRLPEIREEQALLAKEAGVYGFCYWHYWFGENRVLMERPFNEVIDSGKPDFPICLGWANESWMAKQWNKNGKISGRILIKQKYGGENDYRNHFNYLLKAFSDKRYIRIDGKPFFLIYRPLDLDDVGSFMKLWNNMLCEKGIADSFYFVAHARNEDEAEILESMGFDAINIFPLSRKRISLEEVFIRVYNKVKRNVTGIPRLIDYHSIINNAWNDRYESQENIIPTLMPNWDHSPRSGKNAYVINNSTPELWQQYVHKILTGIQSKKNKIVMLKSWNEWGEGNYMEPDLKYGKEYIKVLAKELEHM